MLIHHGRHLPPARHSARFPLRRQCYVCPGYFRRLFPQMSWPCGHCRHDCRADAFAVVAPPPTLPCPYSPRCPQSHRPLPLHRPLLGSILMRPARRPSSSRKSTRRRDFACAQRRPRHGVGASPRPCRGSSPAQTRRAPSLRRRATAAGCRQSPVDQQRRGAGVVRAGRARWSLWQRHWDHCPVIQVLRSPKPRRRSLPRECVLPPAWRLAPRSPGCAAACGARPVRRAVHRRRSLDGRSAPGWPGRAHGAAQRHQPAEDQD